MSPANFLERYKVRCFFHFTDTRNLLSIRSKGGLLPWAQIKEEVRAPGGNKWSHDADAIRGLDQYVHLALLDEHPMEYRAKERGDIVESRFLSIDPSILHREGVLFCPDVSNKSGTTPLSLAKAIDVMDFEVIYDRTDWRDPEIKRRRTQAKKYELLVPGHIPLNLIYGI
ncbi:DarT ssDNA thymidine ADP-ribosyltransferase family protein [Xanthomonas campestris pv. raphani]|uniref:DarT ssDNA thymidine ADP-ribosyltransferase family protein n=1 Tax=Xanthomonas campestris TaxID=339 RepID=UPI002B23E1FC|nr:DarT ssDNA thymidine ADP-ribosyltransferase family protein [Xanthomonas campestris]MEA9904823.1 DarT ssDNA thymidine ADP-ribosyltransferase family protein [Xanthomonas campestris pv. raphani]